MVHGRARVHGGVGVGQVEKDGDGEHRSRPAVAAEARKELEGVVALGGGRTRSFTDGFTGLASKPRASSRRATTDGGVSVGFPQNHHRRQV